MQHHALRTAMTLYSGGTFTLEQAASHAGLTPTRMARCLRARGVAVSTPKHTADPATPDTAETPGEETPGTPIDTESTPHSSVRTDGSGKPV